MITIGNGGDFAVMVFSARCDAVTLLKALAEPIRQISGDRRSGLNQLHLKRRYGQTVGLRAGRCRMLGPVLPGATRVSDGS